jgi:hypothetical protein
MPDLIMKKILSHLGYSTMILLMFACAKTEHRDKDEMVEWKEMDDFHAVMADVFHPLKDSGNLEPIKLRAEELASSASTWADAALPEKVDNEVVRGMLIKLKDSTRSLADQIKAGATDDVIQSELTALHDQFHSVQERWYGGGETHHQH